MNAAKKSTATNGIRWCLTFLSVLASRSETAASNFATAPESQLNSQSIAHFGHPIMKKQKKTVPAPGRSTSRRAFLKAARNAQRRATEAKRAAHAAKLQWKAAKTAYKQMKDAARAAKKAVRAAQKALPAAVREDRKAEIGASKRR